MGARMEVGCSKSRFGSRRGLGGIVGAWIKGSSRSKGRFGSGRGLGGIVGLGRSKGILGSSIKGSRRNSSGLGGGIVGSRRNIKGFKRVLTVARFL